MAVDDVVYSITCVSGGFNTLEVVVWDDDQITITIDTPDYRHDVDMNNRQFDELVAAVQKAREDSDADTE